MERQINASEFRDERQCSRFGVLFEQLLDRMGQSIPVACQDWVSTKATYRLLSNERVNERDIL
ncbi:IS4/Tn5 family transposase DNA-binding protein [Paraburkholderia aspalathi]|uniref:IS4/Tn5 family transposase DNA-binding protein n=1 Tax=Paraburkholderia aspalathi TaxID=1324617 RepID=UPI001BABAAD7